MEQNLNILIKDFQNYCMLTKSEATVKYQKYHFDSMIRYFETDNISSIQEIDKSSLDSMIIHFKKTCKNISINKKILLLKMLYAYHKIEFDYLDNFPKLKQEQNRYNVFKESDLKKIMNYVMALDEDDKFQMTRKLIVLLLLDSGARQSELLNIQIQNIDFTNNTILLTSTKTKIARYVFFSKLTSDLLQRYSQTKPNRKFLFYNFNMKRKYNERDLRTFLNRMKINLGIVKLTARNFRHTIATVLVENGCPLETVQSILGHKSLSTTQIYLHLSVKKHSNDFSRYSVLNNQSLESIYDNY